jgi:hypothetical protein
MKELVPATAPSVSEGSWIGDASTIHLAIAQTFRGITPVAVLRERLCRPVAGLLDEDDGGGRAPITPGASPVEVEAQAAEAAAAGEVVWVAEPNGSPLTCAPLDQRSPPNHWAGSESNRGNAGTTCNSG